MQRLLAKSNKSCDYRAQYKLSQNEAKLFRAKAHYIALTSVLILGLSFGAVVFSHSVAMQNFEYFGPLGDYRECIISSILLATSLFFARRTIFSKLNKWRAI